GVFGIMLGAAGAFGHDPIGPVPARLDVGRLNPPPKKIPKEAVGGGKRAEGYVASYGSFRLGGGKFEGMVVVPGPKPDSTALHLVPIVYFSDYTDPGTGTRGSLYYTSFNERAKRFYLFGNKNLPCDAPVAQRTLIAFDGNGSVLHQVRASYSKTPDMKEE